MWLGANASAPDNNRSFKGAGDKKNLEHLGKTSSKKKIQMY